MTLPALVSLIVLLSAAPNQEKLPLPPDDAQAQATKTIREIFKDEYAAKTPVAQQKLAKKLLQQAVETKDDAASRYILFREAADLASRIGDVDTLLRSLDELCRGFQVDGPALKESFLVKAEAGAAKPDDLKILTEAHLNLTREAIELEQFDSAARSAQSSLTAARKAKDIALSLRAETLLKSVSEMKAVSDKAKKAEQTLLATPEDPAANQAWGEYLCLGKGQWEKGLGFLLKGADSALKALAAGELAGSTEIAPQIELADGWWDLADKEKNPLRKSPMAAHARSFYEKALPNATGLTRAKVEKRLAELKNAEPAAGPRPINRAGLIAWWKLDEGKGTVASNSAVPENEATLMNGMEWVPGRHGTGLKFDGSKSYVSCKAAGLPNLNEPQTLSWWEKHPANHRGGNIICLSNDAQSGGIHAGLGPDQMAVWKLGGKLLMAAKLPKPNVWNHCAYTFDGTRHALYINGKLEAGSSDPPQTTAVTKCEFGRWWGSVGSGYYGDFLDEVRIYNRALSDSEVQGLATGNE